MVSRAESARETGEHVDKPPVVLVALDDTPQAFWAVHEGARLAAALRGSVVLVHVIQPAPVVGDEYAWTSPDLGQMRQAYADRLLRHAAEMVPDSVQCRTMVRFGLPETMIVVAANEAHAAYVVLGTHGRGRIGHLLLGSVAGAVARTAPCPVVVVAHEPSGPAEADTPAGGARLRDAEATVRCRD